MTTALSPAELALLREVRLSDEDHGGLRADQVNESEYEAMTKLCELHLVEALGEYDEAPDGEEDEREQGIGDLVYRITQNGVRALLDHLGAME